MKLWKAKLSRKALDIIRQFQCQYLQFHNDKFLVEPEELEENIPSSSIQELSICEQNVDRYVNKFLKELFKMREIAITMKRMPFRSFKVLLVERLTILKLRQVDSFSMSHEESVGDAPQSVPERVALPSQKFNTKNCI